MIWQRTAESVLYQLHVVADPTSPKRPLVLPTAYEHVFDHFGADTWRGPATLIGLDVEPGLYYLLGRASVAFSEGGYAGSYGAHKVIDICAYFGLEP